MTERDLKTIKGKPGDPNFEACFELMELMRAAVAPYLDERFADPRDALTVLMSTANIFAGVQAGTLMSIGAFLPQDKKRVSDAALTNFRQGMNYGLARGLRVGADLAGGIQ